MNPQRTQTSAGMETVQETVSRIRSRLAEGDGAASPAPGPTTTTSAPSGLVEQLTQRLERQGEGISSSASSSLQQSIQQAIGGVEQGRDAEAMRIQSERDREMRFATGEVGNTFTTAAEGRTGYATQVAALRRLTETTEKSLRDLDQRYQEALLTNNSQAAQQISQLRMKELEFAQEQEQNFYQNMFQLANLEMRDRQFQQQQQQERDLQQNAQEFDVVMFEKQGAREERNMVRELAAEYGVEVSPNETFASMAAKVAPFISEERQLELASMRADIEASNASAAASWQRVRQGQEQEEMDEATLTALATAYANGQTDVVSWLESPQALGQVLDKAGGIARQKEDGLNRLARVATSREDFEAMVQEVPARYTQSDIDRMTAMYSSTWRENRKSAPGDGRLFSKNPVAVAAIYTARIPANVGAAAAEILTNQDIEGFGFSPNGE